MKVIYLLLSVLSVTTAKVQPRVGVNDVFDGVEGILYDIPEYEDPEVSLFKLISRGIMPVVVKGLADLSNKDDKPHYQTDDIKKGLDTVITQLQEAKNKLENGNNAVYLDIDKSVLSLENLKHHLYLDLHSTVAYSKPSATPGIITKGSSDKAPIDQYSIIKASIKKYLSSDYPVYKHFSLDIPTGKALSSYRFPQSSFDDAALIPPSSPTDENLSSSIEPTLSSVSADPFNSDDTSISKPDFAANQKLDSSSEKPSKSVLSSYSDDTSASEPIFSENRNLHLSSEQPLNSEASTEHPVVIDKSVYEFKLLGSAKPPAEMIPYAKQVKIDVVDDASPAKADQAEQGDKALIRKKWSWKLSNVGSEMK